MAKKKATNPLLPTSPTLQQFREAKERHPNMICFFRMGDFYETFDADAELVAKVCGLSVTRRDGVPMVGFPMIQLEKSLHQLLSKGHRVAICEQLKEGELPKPPKVERVVTKGKLVEDES